MNENQIIFNNKAKFKLPLPISLGLIFKHMQNRKIPESILKIIELINISLFKYINQTESHGDIEIPNPFEVCHGEECKGNITTYDFEPGESYKIYVNANKVQIERSDYYILPSFKFHDINKKDDEESDTDSDFGDSFSLRLNFWFISLILLIL